MVAAGNDDTTWITRMTILFVLTVLFLACININGVNGQDSRLECFIDSKIVLTRCLPKCCYKDAAFTCFLKCFSDYIAVLTRCLQNEDLMDSHHY
ncbi:hypothetical protein AQUCO_11500016v1 [Aquilegia coerulea]|uniref:Uncharacterized protein n=1 Tax=Aquilegia coerulea TaxID=218851 RepID=A0A2G5C295_AQUCA|nr:hypothetical protein AQUCO_11500016v1 [Aquilegia coerulea]